MTTATASSKRALLLKAFFDGLTNGLVHPKPHLVLVPDRYLPKGSGEEASQHGFKVGYAITQDLLPGNVSGLTVSDYVDTALTELGLNGVPKEPEKKLSKKQMLAKLKKDREAREQAAVSAVKWAELPDYGDHMTFDEFVDAVQSGMFTNDDGSGRYANEHSMSNVDVDCADLQKGYSHVVWFNK